MPRFAQARPILNAPIGSAAPIQRLVLSVTFAKLKSDFGLREFGAEIKGVSAVRFDSEFVEQRKRILSDKMAGAAVNVNSVLGRLYPIVVVLHLGGNLSDLSTRLGKWLLVVDLQ